jgi:hypothetical protein
VAEAIRGVLPVVAVAAAGIVVGLAAMAARVAVGTNVVPVADKAVASIIVQAAGKAGTNVDPAVPVVAVTRTMVAVDISGGILVLRVDIREEQVAAPQLRVAARLKCRPHVFKPE